MRTENLYLLIGADDTYTNDELELLAEIYWLDDKCEVPGVNFGQLFGDYVVVNMGVNQLMSMGYQNIYSLKYTSESHTLMELGPRLIPYQETDN